MLDPIEIKTLSRADDRFGFWFSREHGWMIRDLQDPRNRQGGSTVFMHRGADWQEIEVAKRNWTEPNYVHADRHLANIGALLRIRAQLELFEFQDALRRRLPALEEKYWAITVAPLRASHARFLARHGLDEEDVYRKPPPYRATNCWSCKASISSEKDLCCKGCQWIICTCGACGCCYPFR